jgi:hypothetical protein
MERLEILYAQDEDDECANIPAATITVFAQQ